MGVGFFFVVSSEWFVFFSIVPVVWCIVIFSGFCILAVQSEDRFDLFLFPIGFRGLLTRILGRYDETTLSRVLQTLADSSSLLVVLR